MALYNTRLQAGLGIISETKTLLGLWMPGMTAAQLYRIALESGQFPNITARRLRDIVVRSFATRYLVANGSPARHLKRLLSGISPIELQQLLLLFTCRTNPILADFIRQVYWEKYAAGYAEIKNEDARIFVESAIDRGKTADRWPEAAIQRAAGDLTGCLADFGLLENGHKTSRRILSFLISPKVLAYIAYDLHLAGLGDNALLSHDDWSFFGLYRQDVLDELKRLSLKGLFIIQAAGDVVRISWKYKDMEMLCDVLAEN